MKYFCIHKGYNHNTNECFKLKDVVEGLIKKAYLTKYVKGGIKDKEESPKSMSP